MSFSNPYFNYSRIYSEPPPIIDPEFEAIFRPMLEEDDDEVKAKLIDSEPDYGALGHGTQDGSHPSGSATPRLFKAHSVMPLYRYWDFLLEDVHITWFIANRPQGPRNSYAGYIEPNPLQGDRTHDAIGLVEESFNADEIRAFADWLPRNFGLEAEIQELELPRRDNSVGVACYGFGGGIVNMDLSRHLAYDLPFEVVGFFDAYQLLDEQAEKLEIFRRVRF